MVTRRVHQTAQALFGLLACLLLGSSLDDAGEFAGGVHTSFLFELADTGWVLLAVAIVLTWWRPRVGAAFALTGCALWTPMIVYLGPRAAADLSWLAGVTALTGTGVVSLLAYAERRQPSRPPGPQPGSAPA
jgi:hypothetical protein